MINNKPFKFTNNDEKIIKKAFEYIIKNAQNKKPARRPAQINLLMVANKGSYSLLCYFAMK